MTHPIDTAYVDIVPVDKSLQKLQRDIDKSMDKIEKDIQKDLDKIDDDFMQTMADIDKHFFKMNKDAQDRFRELEKIVDRSLTEVDKDFDHTFALAKTKFSALGDDSDRSFKRMRSKFLQPLTAGLKSVGGVVSELGKAMFQLVSGIGGAITSNPLMALIVTLIPAIIALSAALSQLIGLVGLVPAGLTVMLAAIIPVVVAFQNFGDAISAIASGDVEKINEALAKLAPNARAVALEIGKMLPALKTLQLTTQQAFFQPLVGGVTQLSKTLLPALEIGFTRVAFAMGTLVRQVLDFFSLPEQSKFIDNLFKSTAHLISTFGPNLVKFIAGFLEVANAALPTLVKLGDAFGVAFGKFGDFMAESAQNGSLQTFIDEALKTVKELFDLLKSVGGLLGTLFAGTEDAGHDFIKSLTEMIIKLDDFLKTAEGQDVIDVLVFSVKALAASLATVIEVTIFFVKTFKMMLKFFADVGKGAVGFVDLLDTVFAKLHDIVVSTIGALPELVVGFFNFMIDSVLNALGLGIGLILFQIQELPRQIIGFLQSLPQRIYDIIITIGPLIALALQGAVDFGRNIIVNGFNEIVAFIMSVPDRLKALIPTFGNAGHNLIQSFMNGFRSVGSFIGDVAGDIVSSVKGFLNKAIDRINSGIATIDAILPGDLGRIPRLAQGAFVPHRPGGVPAIVGEGSEDEWVLPQSKLDALMGSGTTITFGPGAINLNFSGQLPTESEARDVGTVVGQGIIDMITRRNMRVQVRAI